MNDVARASGVSVMTVSNVINGRPNVGAETRLRVLEVVDELGYEINLTARRLRSGRTGTIGLIVPRFDHQYFGELAARLADVLADRDMHLVVEQSGAARERELSALSLARLQQYDGVLLSAVGLDHQDLDRIHSDVPIVLLGEQDVPSRYHRIQMGNKAGGRLATEHLIACGARRIAVLGGRREAPHGEMSTNRTGGWASALTEAGRVADPDMVIPLQFYSTEEAREVMARAVARGLDVDGVFAVTDEIAIGAIAGLHDAGLRVPEDVQVVGFDNLGMSQHIVPGLTSVDPDHEAIATQALELLNLQLTDPGAVAQHLVTDVTLVVRSSTRSAAPHP